MHRIAPLAATLAAGLVLAAPAVAGPAATPTPLAGTTGPGFTITLTKAGKAVKTLKPGSYAITIKDKATAHNFSLFGPGVKKVGTDLPFVGTKKITVTLKKGTYTFQCDPHARAGMKGTFKVA